MKKYPVYPATLYVNYDHTVLYIVIGIVILLMIVGFVGYRIYVRHKKKKEKEVLDKINISFVPSKRNKNTTLK